MVKLSPLWLLPIISANIRGYKFSFLPYLLVKFILVEMMRKCGAVWKYFEIKSYMIVWLLVPSWILIRFHTCIPLFMLFLVTSSTFHIFIISFYLFISLSLYHSTEKNKEKAKKIIIIQDPSFFFSFVIFFRF